MIRSRLIIYIVIIYILTLLSILTGILYFTGLNGKLKYVEKVYTNGPTNKNINTTACIISFGIFTSAILLMLIPLIIEIYINKKHNI